MREISDISSLSKITVHRVLTDELGMINVCARWVARTDSEAGSEENNNYNKQEMLQYVTNAPEGPLCVTHLLIMLYLSVMFR